MSERAFITLVFGSALGVLVLAGFLLASGLAHAEIGTASVYGGADGLCGSRTANGEHLNCGALTAASPNLRLGSHARVCHGERCVTVRINDRGPARWTHRVIDLSPASARALGISGLGRVSVEALP